MTELTEKMISEISRLPDDQQNAIAKLILNEIHSEKKWGELLSESEGTLETLANEALEEHEKGNTEPLDPDNL